MKNCIFFILILLSCGNPYPSAKRELIEPTIQTLDRDLRTQALKIIEQDATIVKQASQISTLMSQVTTLKSRDSAFAKDTLLRSRQNVLLQRQVSTLTNDFNALESSYNLTFYWWKKDTLTNGIARRTLLKDVAVIKPQLAAATKFNQDQTVINSTNNTNFYWWKKDTLLKGIAVRALIKDSLWQSKQIYNLQRKDISLEALINKQVPSGQIATVQKQLTLVQAKYDTLVKTLGADFDLNIKKELQISDSGMNRIEKKITDKR